MAVAALVDNADAGMDIESTAQAVNFDFLPVGSEKCDFATPMRLLELSLVQKFLEVLCSEDFQAQVEFLGGYQCRRTGEII